MNFDVDTDVLLDQYFSLPRDNQCTHRVLSRLLSEQRVDEMKLVYRHAGVIPTDACEPGHGNNAIGYLLLCDDYPRALCLFQHLHSMGKSRRKQLDMLIRYMIQRDVSETENLYLGFVMSYDRENRVLNDDVDIFYGIGNISEDILRLFLGKRLYCNLNVPTVSAESLPLRKLYYNEDEQDTMLRAMQRLFRQRKREFMGLLMDENWYDYIIDGANVLFFGAKDPVRAYKNIVDVVQMLPQDKTILLVLHQDHFKMRPEWSRYMCSEIRRTISTLRGRCTILETAPKINDDYYSLLCSIIRPGSLLVTNDKFRDHIFAQETEQAGELLKTWREESVVEYDMNQLYMPKSYSIRVQCSNGQYYIPHSNGGWTIVFPSA